MKSFGSPHFLNDEQKLPEPSDPQELQQRI
jgi:hypothetical protein